MLRYYTLNIIIFLFLFTSCKKENMCDCLKSTGKEVKETRQTDVFEEISLEDNINLFITQDTFNRIIVEAGEHLQKLIKTEVRENCLYITNDNTCNWVRSYDKQINVYLSMKNLRRLISKGSGDIISTDTIRANILDVNNDGGTGVIDMLVDANESYFRELIGPADFKIKGKSNYNYIWTAGYGKMDCRDLISYDALIVNNGTNDCYVNVSNNLKAVIFNTGNIYYSGNPKNINKTVEGSGKVLPD